MFTELGILALINLYQLDYSITGGVNIDELMRKGDYIVNSLLLIYVNE